MAAPHRILLLAFPNGQLLDIAGPLQMFAGANDELARQVYRIDLALAMIEADLGREVRLAIERWHVVFRIRPGGQSQFSAELVAQSAGNPKIKKLAEKVTAQPRTDWRTDVLAAEAGVSRRSLSRLFRMGLDVSPADFVERVRTDLARRRLLESNDNLETIAVACGFGSLRRMDRASARAMSASHNDCRSRFKTNGAKHVAL